MIEEGLRNHSGLKQELNDFLPVRYKFELVNLPIYAFDRTLST